MDYNKQSKMIRKKQTSAEHRKQIVADAFRMMYGIGELKKTEIDLQLSTGGHIVRTFYKVKPR